MTIFRDFEIEVLRILVEPILGLEVVARVAQQAELVKYWYSGCGYFLTVRHPELPSERIVCEKPIVVGQGGDMQGGFLIFLGKGELTLECYDMGVNLPEDFRDQHIRVMEKAHG